jgi:gluconokinase
VNRVLVLDVGTSSVRVRVYDEAAELVKGEEWQTRYRVVHGRGGEAELDPDHLVHATEAAIDRVVQVGERVDAVGISCFWHSLLALDDRSRPASPLFIWQDTRSAPQAEWLAAELGAGAVHARTGCYPHPSYWPAVLLWLRERRPELFRAARRFVSFGEYLLHRLTGDVRMSVSMASGTGLLDVNRLEWDEELLAAVGVDPDRLPELSDEAVGGERPVYPALGDGACSNVGVGCVARDRAALTIGTSGAVRAVYEAERATPRPGLFLYRLDARRFVEGGSFSDGGNLYAWLDRTLKLPAGRDVSDRPPAGHGLAFVPSLGGERSPGWSGRARGAIHGLTFDTKPVDLLQAAQEAVAYRFADVLELMPEVRKVVTTGAALRRNSGWTQILADVLDRPLHPSAVDEGSARGAAVMVLERNGIAAPPAPLLPPVEPRPGRTAAHAAARERLRELARS